MPTEAVEGTGTETEYDWVVPLPTDEANVGVNVIAPKFPGLAVQVRA